MQPGQNTLQYIIEYIYIQVKPSVAVTFTLPTPVPDSTELIEAYRWCNFSLTRWYPCHPWWLLIQRLILLLYGHSITYVLPYNHPELNCYMISVFWIHSVIWYNEGHFTTQSRLACHTNWFGQVFHNILEGINAYYLHLYTHSNWHTFYLHVESTYIHNARSNLAPNCNFAVKVPRIIDDDDDVVGPHLNMVKYDIAQSTAAISLNKTFNHKPPISGPRGRTTGSCWQLLGWSWQR